MKSGKFFAELKRRNVQNNSFFVFIPSAPSVVKRVREK